ncbi:MAG TPA: AraC family transcriptional regulator [Vicinamibacterales bacterium]
MPPPIAWYREFVPCEALRADVYAVFSFVPGWSSPPARRSMRCEIPFRDPTFCSPQFADGHVSMLFELGHTCGVDGHWRSDAAPHGSVTGPMSEVGRTTGSDRPDMIGVYFRPGRAAAFLSAAMPDLTDLSVAIDDVWGTAGLRLAEDLADLDEAIRIERLESHLVAMQLGRPRPSSSIEMTAVTAHMLRHRGRVTIDAMARHAGVSRQHFSRQFREQLGIAPKLYCRLARFQAGLAPAHSQETIGWAETALDLGYADQSHMIAEFRQFSSLTPQALISGRWFHPFIERARRIEQRSVEGPSVARRRVEGTRSCQP